MIEKLLNQQHFLSFQLPTEVRKGRILMSSNSILTTLYIDDMTCVNCENTIEHALSGITGIEKVKASYSTGTVAVTYNPDEIELEKIEELIEKHDYHVKREKGKNKEGKKETSDSETNYLEINDVKTKDEKTKKTVDYTNIIGIGIIIFTIYTIVNRFGLTNIFNAFPIAKEGMGYSMLFVIGLLTSVHCVAMCGGICISQCASKEGNNPIKTSKLATLRPSLLYNTGRVISYTVIGGIVGALGSVVSFSGTMKGIVQLLAGVFMIIMGLNMLNIFPWLRRFNPRMPKIFAKKIYKQRAESNSPLLIGLINGLMPCGPLQAMQLYALSTGDPLKGAFSMFLFSVGTFPLMFAFGALSSFLSKKFTGKMMKASAVLVLVLGVFMFNSGVVLSGFSLPSFPSATSSAQTSNTATVKDGIQTVTTGLNPGSYEPIIVQKGIPVKWTIQAEAGDINGCNNSIVVPKFNIQQDLSVGDTVIEFTPTSSGTYPYSCWMGMIRSKITVVDDLSTVDSNSVNSEDNGANGLDNADNLIDYQIPTDELSIAKVKGDKQTVDITFDENGFSPAVIIVQKDLETVWNINGKNVDTLPDNTLVFPYYGAQLEVKEGENPITLYPDQDFDFSTSDTKLYGYVKVVDDINNIDIEAIKKEVSEYRPTDYYAGGGGLPSCH
jgi:sulfite exporter TauE/SafE/copper chaperone CopZ